MNMYKVARRKINADGHAAQEFLMIEADFFRAGESKDDWSSPDVYFWRVGSENRGEDLVAVVRGFEYVILLSAEAAQIWQKIDQSLNNTEEYQPRKHTEPAYDPASGELLGYVTTPDGE